MDQRNFATAEMLRALELDAPGPRLALADEATAANARAAAVAGKELCILRGENALRIELQLGVALLIERVRRDRMGRAAARGVGSGEDCAAVVIDFRHDAIRGRAGIAGKRAAFQDMTGVISKPGVNAVANHIGGKERAVATAPSENEIRAIVQRRQQRMDAHLPDNDTFTQRILAEGGAG